MGPAMCELLLPAVVCVWVGGWLAGCVSVRVQELVAERARVLVGYTLDY